MKKNIGLVVSGILAAFLVVNLVYAQGDSEMTKDLNLTPQQQQKLRDNRKAQRERMLQLVNQMKEKQQILRQELKKPSVTKASLTPILAEIKSLQAQLIDSRVEGILAVKEILTPEQFAKFQEATTHRQKGMGERFHQWRENRGKRMKYF